MEYQYKIRPHHGMCIAFFRGNGYSDEFVAHMSGILHKLEDNPIICITTQTDIICSKCPNNMQGVCETEEKVAEYDRQVLKRCGLSDGMILPYLDFRKLVYEKVLSSGKREEICGNCEWDEICHFNIVK